MRHIAIVTVLAALAAWGVPGPSPAWARQGPPPGTTATTRPDRATGAGPATQPDRPVGLAARYPGDVGIEQDPAVLFVETFEGETVAHVGRRWNSESNRDGRVMALSDDVPPGSAGRRSLQVTATLGQDTGGHLYKVLRPGADRVFARFYVKFADDCPYIHHFVTMGALRDAPNWPMGEAGLRPDGRRRFTSGLEPWGMGGRAPPPGAWNFYSYWHGMRRSGDGKYWGNSFRPDAPALVARGRWICVESLLQANSAPDKPDGAQAFWIDGAQTGRFENIHWRTADDLKVNFFWLMLYVTENAARQNRVAEPNKVARVWFDDVVLATEYIGPLAPAPRSDPAAEPPSR